MRAVALLAALGLVAIPCLGRAEDTPQVELLPDDYIFGSMYGTYVNAVTDPQFKFINGTVVDIAGNKSNYLQDYNLQDGVGAQATAAQDWADNRNLHIEGAGQSGEQQGYFIGRYSQLQHYSLLADVSGTQRYYNTRTGLPEGFAAPPNFPGTNNGNVIFGNDDPSIHRIDTTVVADYQPALLFHDVYLSFRYLDVFGEQTPLKAGNVDGTAPTAPGSGPGSVAFDFPSRDQVDTANLGGYTGGRTDLGGLNWQTDAAYNYSRVRSDLTEPILGQSLSTSELDGYQEHTDAYQVKYDLVASRFFGSKLYTYGGYLLQYEHSNPGPTQNVARDAADPTSTVETRDSTGGKVNRWGNSLTAGLLYRPHNTVVVTADSRAAGHTQSGDLTQNRNEILFPVGNVGAVRNDVDRWWVDSNTTLLARWTGVPQLVVSGLARYHYRHQDTNSTREFNFVQQELPEIEDYDNNYNRADAGAKARYSAGHGRYVEAGYRFLYEDVDVGVSQLQNGYIQNSYIRRRQQPYVKATARLRPNLRAELGFEYNQETRSLNAPLIEPDIFPTASGGTTRWEAYSVIPTLFYQPDPHWGLYGSVAIAQQKLSIDNPGQVPPNFSVFGFEYNTLTETFSTGVSYAPSSRWSTSLSYTFINSTDSVDNDINRVQVVGQYKVTDRWGVAGGYRYLRFDQANTNVDNYRTSLFFLGVTGKF